ncbi:MAG: hypothetical protein ACRCTR_06230 [Actinomycetota bacterium]
MSDSSHLVLAGVALVASLLILSLIVSIVLSATSGLVRLIAIPLRLIVAVARGVLLGAVYVGARVFFAARGGATSLARRARS